MKKNMHLYLLLIIVFLASYKYYMHLEIQVSQLNLKMIYKEIKSEPTENDMALQSGIQINNESSKIKIKELTTQKEIYKNLIYESR